MDTITDADIIYEHPKEWTLDEDFGELTEEGAPVSWYANN